MWFDLPENLDENMIEREFKMRLQDTANVKKLRDYMVIMNGIAERHFPSYEFTNDNKPLAPIICDIILFRCNFFGVEFVRLFLHSLIREYDCKENMLKFALELNNSYPYISGSQILTQIMLYEDL